MIRVLVTVLFFSFCMPIVKAQNVFTLAQLIETFPMNDDDLDTRMASKGFVFRENINDRLMVGKCYSKEGKLELKDGVPYKNEWAYIKAYIYGVDTTAYAIYNTGNTDEYLAIKSEAKKLGFIYTETVEYEGKNQLKYEKDNLVLTLIPKTKSGNSLLKDNPLYEITISLKKSN